MKRSALPLVRGVQGLVRTWRMPPHGPGTDACGSCGRLRRLSAQDLPPKTFRARPPAQDLPRKPFSTNRRQTGILMDVHPVLRETPKLRHLQLPRSGADGQLIESPRTARMVCGTELHKAQYAAVRWPSPVFG
jgi:hypothetical protein